MLKSNNQHFGGQECLEAWQKDGSPLPKYKPLDTKTIKRLATYCNEYVTDEDAIQITRLVEAEHGIRGETNE